MSKTKKLYTSPGSNIILLQAGRMWKTGIAAHIEVPIHLVMHSLYCLIQVLWLSAACSHFYGFDLQCTVRHTCMPAQSLNTSFDFLCIISRDLILYFKLHFQLPWQPPATSSHFAIS